MAILLLADHDNSTLSDQTAKALTAAAQIGGDVHVLVAARVFLRGRTGRQALGRRQGADR